MGPVIMFCGLAIMLFSIEVCIRFNTNQKRVQDPEIDLMTNLHHIKHWMDPGKAYKIEHFEIHQNAWQ